MAPALTLPRCGGGGKSLLLVFWAAPPPKIPQFENLPAPLCGAGGQGGWGNQYNETIIFPLEAVRAPFK